VNNDLTRWISVRIDDELYGAMRRVAARERVSMSDTWRMAAIEFLSQGRPADAAELAERVVP